MSPTVTETVPSQLSIKPSTLYAAHPDGASLFVERLAESPSDWLSENGVKALPESIPVIVLLDSTESRVEWCDVVALEYGDEAPLLRIERAIAALQMAHAALTAAGQVDFIPKGGRQ